MPDPTISSDETGTRHRTAERVAKQTEALVISISQQRETVTVFLGQPRYQLDPIADVLAKTNQAVATLDTYRQRLEQVLMRLTALEFQNAVDARRRARRAPARGDDDAHGGGDRAQLRRARRRGPADPDAARRARRRGAGREGARSSSTTTSTGGADGDRRRSRGWRAMPYQDLLEFERLTELLGYARGVEPARSRRRAARLPRALAHPAAARRGRSSASSATFGGLETIVRASQRELEAVEGVGAVRAPRDPRGPAAAPGAQPGRAVPAAVSQLVSRAFS